MRGVVAQNTSEMFVRSLLSVSMAGILVWLCDECAAKRNWEYEPLSIEPHSTDESKGKLETTIERVARGEYAISADLLLLITTDDDTMVEAKGYRSSSGSEDDYKLLPWAIPKQTFQEFIESHYGQIVYSNFGECSNIPDVEHAYPWPKGKYHFERCTASGEGMPEIAPEGYYKIYFNVTGEIDIGFKVIVKVTTTSDLIG